MRSVLLTGTLLAATALSLVLGAPASATLDPPRLISVNGREQADRAGAPAISADGRYVAFEATLGGTRGVFRRDVASGAVDLVAGGDAYAPGSSAADAVAPSISADGRYVSLTTAARLDSAHDANTARDVYVRDMATPDGFTLASARDGGVDGLTYAPGSGTGTGARAAGRVALSADGRHVAFVVEAISDLAGPATPGGQIALRDLDTQRTTLVSAARDRTIGQMADRPVPGGAVTASAAAGSAKVPGAAVSADGTTVAWLGAHVPDQVPTLADERQEIDALDANAGATYDEPLWRRVADGPAAPTRRVVGGGDPLAPGCPADGTRATPACAGPFPGLTAIRVRASAAVGGWLDLPDFVSGVPHLSADGRTVALLGNPTEDVELFAVDMRDGLSRAAAVRQVTRVPPFRFATELGGGAYGDLADVGLSADGRWAGIATDRSPFLPPPNLIGTPLPSIGLPELYRVDLRSDTIERITVPPAGGPSGPATGQSGDLGARAPSFSADARTIAFSSTAANLVDGDANGAADAFTVTDAVVADDPGTWTVTPTPPGPAVAPEWRMAVSVRGRTDGTVRLDVVAPGAGTVRVTVRATVPVTRTVRVRRKVRRGGRVVTRTVTRRVTTDVARDVATGKATARADGPIVLTLRPAARYRALAKRSRGLRGTVAVRFTSPAGPALKDTLTATFRVAKKQAKPKPKTASSGASHR